MAGEKLTQIKVRNGNRTVVETIPISVSVENIKYDNNTSLKEKIDSLKLDSKLNKNLGSGKKGQFLIVGTNGDVETSALNTGVIKASLNIPTDLNQFENTSHFVTEEDLKNKYSLEYTQNANLVVTDNTIKGLQKNVINLQNDLTKFKTTTGNNQTSNERKFITLNQQVNDIYSFMQDTTSYYNTRKGNATTAVNTKTAKQIIDNTNDIAKIKSDIKEILGTNETTGQITSGRIGALESNFAAFKKSIEDVDGVNKLGRILFNQNTKLNLGDINGVTTDVSIWGNADNQVGISATNTVDNKRYGIWARLGTRLGTSPAYALSNRGISIYNYTDQIWEYNTQRYQPGETITLTNGQIYTGYVTTSGRDLKFFIPLRKSVRWCSIENFKINWNRSTDDVLYIRGIQGTIRNQTGTYQYYFNPKNTKSVNNKVTTRCYPKENGIELRFTGEKAFVNAVNETPIIMHLAGHDMYITVGTRPKPAK